MAWVKLDDGFFLHPKVLGLSKGAKLLYLSGLTYASGQLTDGRLSRAAVAMAAKVVGVPTSLAGDLAATGLWEATEDGYVIHDYHLYNPTREKVLRTREATARRVRDWHEKHRTNGVTQRPANGVSNGATNAVTNAPIDPVPSRPHEAAPTSEPKERKTNTEERQALALAPPARPGLRAVPKEGQGVPVPHRAMIAALGEALGAPRTKGDWGKYAAAAADLCRAGAEPGRVGWLVDRWGELFPGATCTPTALSNNFAALTSGRPAANGRRDQFAGIKQMLADDAANGAGLRRVE